MKRFVSYLGCAVVVWSFSVSPAWAIAQFFAEFKAKYADPDGNQQQKDLADKIEELTTVTRCNICHVGKKDRKQRNAYGQALSELLDKKEDKDNKEKIQEALDTVAEIHTDPEDEESPTFGDLLLKGEFPLEPTVKEPEAPAK